MEKHDKFIPFSNIREAVEVFTKKEELDLFDVVAIAIISTKDSVNKKRNIIDSLISILRILGSMGRITFQRIISIQEEITSKKESIESFIDGALFMEKYSRKKKKDIFGWSIF